jgi:short subunit dehydrogenase-like uncharacterized protein
VPADVPDLLDLVLYGATGFVGRLTAEHLARTAPPGTRIGLAGRSKDKLVALRTELGAPAQDWPLLVADAADPATLAELAAATRVVATTVGPYGKYDGGLAHACAEAGTHYCDLTGEVPFIRTSIDRSHDTAVASGARLAHACGFDSVPSDLGVLLLHQLVQADGEGELEDTTLVLEAIRGGISGGTIDSMRTVVDEIKGNPATRRTVLDPYSLSPDRDAEPDLGPQRNGLGLGRSAELGGIWTAPFVMAPFNTRVVRRSNALQGWAYGRRFRYDEVMSTGRKPWSPALALGTAVGIGGMGLGMAVPPTRFLLDKVLPAPGEGPSEATREKGHFRVRVHTRTSTGARYDSVVAAQGDPGYAATAVMFGQSALALALDGDRLPGGGGVLTPATGLGAPLVDRLRAQGFTLEVSRSG